MEVSILYYSRFGTTTLLVEKIVEGLQAEGKEGKGIFLTPDLPPPPEGKIVLVTPIFWDLPPPIVRRFLKKWREDLKERVVGVGVVCGSAGVREGGGLSYARFIGRKFRSTPFLFALSGRIPPRELLSFWEWGLLKGFSFVMRKPHLFSIEPDWEKAFQCGRRIGALLGR
jgi:hypothetical protein